MFVKEGTGTLRDMYKVGKVLGEGAYGEVRICTHRDTKQKRAVKVLKKEIMTSGDQQTMINEISILRKLDHPNIVKIYEYFEDPKRYYIITDHIQGGELFDEIIQRGKFSEYDCAVILKQILSAVSYCHHYGVIHRDLKPENLLLEASKEFDQIKLIDFGTAVRKSKGQVCTETIGTAYYIAPEVLNGQYGKECDIWSIGVIAYILLSGTPPFRGKNDEEILKNIKKQEVSFSGPSWKGVSADAVDFVKSCFLSAKQRITAHIALKHPFIVQKNLLEKVDKDACSTALNNLISFHSQNTMRVATLSFIGSQLMNKEERESLARVFKAMDTNSDGKLTKEEIKAGYATHFGRQISDKELHSMFERVDTDKSGFIDYTEFLVASCSEKDLLTKQRLKSAFKMFDRDAGGTISADEIREVLKGLENRMPKELIDQLIAQIDQNGDGEISLDEFIHFMSQLGQ